MAKPRGRPFQSGNHAGRGRPRGSRNKTTLVAQGLFDEHAAALTKKCVLLALQGDPTAQRLCMERILPARRGTLVKFKLPAVNSLADVPVASQAVLQAVAKGKLTLQEGQQMMSLLESAVRVWEVEELRGRLQALEDQLAGEGGPGEGTGAADRERKAA